jgi:hypothetical protein
MKNTLLFFLFLFLINNCFTQWQPDVRLTIDPGESREPVIAASGNSLHIVWEDDGDGNWEIYYKRSVDGGYNWGPDTRLTVNTAESRYPYIAVSGSNVHVVWVDTRNGNWTLFYKLSTDNGSTWTVDAPLTNPGSLRYPAIAASGLNIHAVWYDYRDGNWEIYYKNSANGGFNWNPDIRLTNQSGWSNDPIIAVTGSIVHIVWSDDRDGNEEIYYKRSLDNGTNWSSDTRLTNAPSNSYNPVVSVSGQYVHVVWHDYRNSGSPEIYYKRSVDGGNSWGDDIRLTNNPFDSNNPSVIAAGSSVHIAFNSFRDGNSEIYYKRSVDNGISWEGDTRLTFNPLGSFASSITVSGSQVHTVWYDLRDGNTEIYYKQNPIGNPIGIINISSEIPAGFSLGQNYPNPFNPVTKFKFHLPQFGFVTIIIYDNSGKEVYTLVKEFLAPGVYETVWNASEFSSGVYFYRIIAVGEGLKFTKTLKMILVK